MSAFFSQVVPLLFMAASALDANAPNLNDEYDIKLQAIYAEYEQLGTPPDIATLVRLDKELRKLVPIVAENERSNGGRIHFREEFTVLGLEANHWSGYLEYNGAPLKRAHELDPNSPHRSSTLFSSIEIDYTRSGLPGIDNAHRYILEFPDGPFIVEVNEILATFYDDLYKLLRGKVKDEDTGFEMDFESCYAVYFTALPFEMQMVQAQALADQFYGEALAKLDSDSPRSRKLTPQREALRNGTTKVWYWCSPC
jgi:hypothetical protein